MTKSVFVLAFYMLLTIAYANGQNKMNSAKTIDTIITQIEYNGEIRGIILLEDTDYIIMTRIDLLEPNINPWLSFCNTNAIDKAIIDTIKANAKQAPLIHAWKIILQENRVFLFNYLIAKQLEQGKCFIFDKKNKKTIKSIRMEIFNNKRPRSGCEGRKFYIGNKLILTVEDNCS